MTPSSDVLLEKCHDSTLSKPLRQILQLPTTVPYEALLLSARIPLIKRLYRALHSNYHISKHIFQLKSSEIFTLTKIVVLQSPSMLSEDHCLPRDSIC